MGKQTGVKTRPQRKTAAAKAQRVSASKLSRPGKRPYSKDEEAGRIEAVRIGRALNPRILRVQDKRLSITERMQDRIEIELRAEKPDFEVIQGFLTLCHTNMDLVSMYKEVADRFGFPRKTESDLRFEGSVSMPIVIADEGQRETWAKKEDEHAAGLAGDGDGS